MLISSESLPSRRSHITTSIGDIIRAAAISSASIFHVKSSASVRRRRRSSNKSCLRNNVTICPVGSEKPELRVHYVAQLTCFGENTHYAACSTRLGLVIVAQEVPATQRIPLGKVYEQHSWQLPIGYHCHLQLSHCHIEVQVTTLACHVSGHYVHWILQCRQ